MVLFIITYKHLNLFEKEDWSDLEKFWNIINKKLARSQKQNE